MTRFPYHSIPQSLIGKFKLDAEAAEVLSQIRGLL